MALQRRALTLGLVIKEHRSLTAPPYDISMASGHRSLTGNHALHSKIARFVLLSGCCWLLDLSMLLILSTALGWHPIPANVTSSLVAAAVVYVIAHGRIHGGAHDSQALRLAAYLCYTFGVIMASSWVLGQLCVWLGNVLGSGIGIMLTAKVMITPPQLFFNFIVSRLVACMPLGSKVA